VFKPHTGTKTSVLLVQKWNDDTTLGDLCPRLEDYPIFFATMQEPSKDNSGDKVYVKDAQGVPILDDHGHLIVKHDLYRHDAVLSGAKFPITGNKEGIAEAFLEFAKREGFTFVKKP
jgi:type I restriction enzyme M protein